MDTFHKFMFHLKPIRLSRSLKRGWKV